MPRIGQVAKQNLGALRFYDPIIGGVILSHFFPFCFLVRLYMRSRRRPYSCLPSLAIRYSSMVNNRTSYRSLSGCALRNPWGPHLN